MQCTVPSLSKCHDIWRTLSNYTYGFWNISSDKPGYSGVTILTRSKPNSVLFGFEHSSRFHEEARVVTLRYDDAVIIGVYSPAVGASDDSSALNRRLEFDRLLFEHCLSEKALGLPIYVLGDLNITTSDKDLYPGCPWVALTSPDLRKNHTRLLREIGLYDSGSRSHLFTWYEDPT